MMLKSKRFGTWMNFELQNHRTKMIPVDSGSEPVVKRSRGDGGPYYEDTPFKALVELLERLANAGTRSKGKEREGLMDKFFSEKAYGWGHFFPVYRLLLPKGDNERTTYGMKEKNIGKAYVEILAIPPDSEDGQRLLKFQIPSATHRNAGDFSTAVYLSLEKRLPAERKVHISIAQVNDYLDRIARASDMVQKKQFLKELLGCTTAVMQKWIMRIILKDLKLGASDAFFLNFLHPDALTLKDMRNNLREVCEQLTDRSKRMVDVMLKIMQPSKPMLAQQADHTELKYHDRQYVVETKYDGYRVQIHRSGDQIAYFSRACVNHASAYAPMMDHILKKHVMGDNYILDGELLTWHKKGGPDGNGYFGKFKEVRSHAREDRERREREGLDDADNDVDGLPVDRRDGPLLPTGSDTHLVLMVFDILMHEGRSLINLPLSNRDAILRQAVKPLANYLELTERRNVSSVDDVDKAIDTAIRLQHEGIMIKDWDQAYIANERKWIKVKPDYLQGVGDPLDLVIVGTFMGEGNSYRAGTPSHFLMGVPASVANGAGGQQTNKWATVCKVGTGYTADELRTLQYRLNKYLTAWDPKQKLIELTPTAEAPHFYLDPRAAKDAGVVIEVRYASIEPSDKYRVGYTLRHPRVENIRYDKGIEDCNTFEDVIARVQQQSEYGVRSLGSARLAGRAGFHKGKKAEKKKTIAAAAKRTTATQIASAQVAPWGDLSVVERVSDMWAGWKFYVVGGSEANLGIVNLIVQNGGECINFPNNKTTCIVTDTVTFQVKTRIETNLTDVVKPQWIKECVLQKRVVDYEPRWMIHATPATRAKMLKEIDVFGDSYTRDLTPSSLRDVFAFMDTAVKDEWEGNNSVEAREELRPALGNPFFSMFHDFVFYVDCYSVVGNAASFVDMSPLEVTRKLILYYGGSLSTTLDHRVTHVVMHPGYLGRFKKIREKMALGQKFVSSEWVHKSVEKHEALVEDAFSILDINRANKRLKKQEKQAESQQRRSLSLAASQGSVSSLGL